jgi:hypothetical protein
MIDKIVLKIVITFILRQLAKFEKTVDWALVKADLSKRVADLLPGTWFDAEAVVAVHALVDAAHSAIAATGSIDAILQKLAAQDWQGAFDALRDLVVKVWKPMTVKEQQLAAVLPSLDLAA